MSFLWESHGKRPMDRHKLLLDGNGTDKYVPWTTLRIGSLKHLKNLLYWNIFYHSGFLSNLRLPWIQSLPWSNCIEYISFIIQDLWATCACPEKWAALKFFTVLRYFLSFGIFEQLALALKAEFALQFFKTGGAASPPDTPPRTPMIISTVVIFTALCRFLENNRRFKFLIWHCCVVQHRRTGRHFTGGAEKICPENKNLP